MLVKSLFSFVGEVAELHFPAALWGDDDGCLPRGIRFPKGGFLVGRNQIIEEIFPDPYDENEPYREECYYKVFADGSALFSDESKTTIYPCGTWEMWLIDQDNPEIGYGWEIVPK